MAGSSKKGDNMLQDLNLDGIEGLEGVQSEIGGSIPRKVELDIDDMILEEEFEDEEPGEVETPSEPEVELPEEPEETPEKPPRTKKKLSLVKLLIIGVAILIPLIGLTVGGMYYFSSEPEPVPQGTSFDPNMSLLPFIINYPKPNDADVMLLEMTITFPNQSARLEFEENMITYRDMIYRFIQGRGPLDLENPDIKKAMAEALVELVNGTIVSGEIKKIQITKMKEV